MLSTGIDWSSKEKSQKGLIRNMILEGCLLGGLGFADSSPVANIVERIVVVKKLTDDIALVGEVISEMVNDGTLEFDGLQPHRFDSRDLDMRVKRVRR